MADSHWPAAVSERAQALQAQLEGEIRQFIATHRLPAAFMQLVEDYYLPLAVWLARQQRDRGGPLVVGLCGGQGSGKSTLTAFLQLVWQSLGIESAGFSLDDIYLTRAERQQLARRVHPLLATRGVPGTHDVQLGVDTIDRLTRLPGGQEVPIPRFDKATDDRAPRETWSCRHSPVDILLFEGWCVGALPWQDQETPVNELERSEDPRGIWRDYVRAQLDGPYRELFSRLHLLLMLRVPDMASVLEWRRLQEEKLREATGGGMSDAEVERFVQHYERVTRTLLDEMPRRADCVLELGRDHRVCGLRLNQ
ncbi:MULTISPECIES: phosphoribulokinase [unclassified Microbulbifer]|uniref:phosphoribulokinase n=1 Tax=unclassified Microbulbifer TaxID=2619833 RepID=UPI001E37BC63|nr:phosphoribulokinase [Microbulbifer sp. YPW16]UHQ56660.1 phosphoribulokinase [Microbulbifer sp. YPW16]